MKAKKVMDFLSFSWIIAIVEVVKKQAGTYNV